jgi:trans-aconitate methyltransferase
VVGIDLAAEAVRHATATFGGPGVRFLQAACETLPFADGAFDLVVAFEVIEHLEKWRMLLDEARRVLRPTGMLLVSTPNKAYYAETRAAAGPNPFHVHEFEYGEFRAALTSVFPHVHLWSQNHSEAIVFAPETPSPGALDAPGDSRPENAHFLLAACSQSRIADTNAFAWLPEAGNLLRERERHIALLEAELRQKTDWLKQTGDSHAALQHAHEDLLKELETTHNGYKKQIADLDKELKTAHAGYEDRISELEAELKTVHAGYEERIAILAQEGAARLAWVGDLESQIALGRQEIERLNGENERYYASILKGQRNAEGLEAELQRTKADVHSLEAELERMEAEREPIEAENGWLRAERRKIAQSKWLRLGRVLGLGPVVKSD